MPPSLLMDLHSVCLSYTIYYYSHTICSPIRPDDDDGKFFFKLRSYEFNLYIYSYIQCEYCIIHVPHAHDVSCSPYYKYVYSQLRMNTNVEMYVTFYVRVYYICRLFDTRLTRVSV